MFPHFGVVLLAQIPGTILRGVVAENVSGIEVVVSDEVGVEEHSLDDHGKVVGSVESQSHLSLGHTIEAAATTEHDVVEQPCDGADRITVLGEFLLKCFFGCAFDDFSSNER